MSAVYRVDLGAFADNLRRIRETVAPAEHMLVVKDDAYAHGLAAIVTRARDEGVRWFGAFDVETGVAVRETLGPDVRIFVWLLGGADDLATGAAAGLDLGIGDQALLDALEALPAGGPPARVHLKIDTGLHRNGIRPERWDAALDTVVALVAAGRAELTGIWSHISEASDEDDDDARALFLAAREAAAARGLTPAVAHLAASAAGFARAPFREDLVRIGAFSYGIRPAGGPSDVELGIRPIGTVDAAVLDVADTAVHLDVGSLHGLPQTLAGRFDVRTLAGPRRVRGIEPTRLVVDPWPGAQRGQRVAVFGGGAEVTATDLAELVDTIGEEIALRVSPVLPRVYEG
ncbi:alanine racemase [Microbacterium sp. LMI1-1-1.1]|uniref:alanine racemase n=1 Tax=Microbacterium sp. LMI1-1-1.1 TaxID=3135223 RepID=UPI0034674DA0